jgi:hypothetical protein
MVLLKLLASNPERTKARREAEKAEMEREDADGNRPGIRERGPRGAALSCDKKDEAIRGREW